MMYRQTSVKRIQIMILLYLKRTVPDGQTQAAVASSTILTTVAIQAVERIIPMYRMTIPAVMTI